MQTKKLAPLVCLSLFGSACGLTDPNGFGAASPAPLVEPPSTTAALGASSSAETGKVDVCHRTGVGFSLLSIGPNALPEHLAHGDGVPSGPVPGSSAKVFNATCVATTVAAIQASPTTVEFGEIASGETSASRVITV